MTPSTNDFGDEAERSVQNYLETFLSESPPTTDIGHTFQRVICCNSSRSLYCEECCRLLVQDDLLPISCRRKKHSEERPLKLPFNLHIILDDRRKSATGLHAVALLNGIGDGDETSYDSSDLESVKLVDLEKDDVPRYGTEDASTFLLFPSHGESVPLEAVASKLRTLVVLDCKWTSRGICEKNEGLSSLQKVHLSFPPKQSYYWRWHNAGHGMLSTIEAIYFAALEISQVKYGHLLDADMTLQSELNDHVIDQNNLIHLLWLFGHQRAATIISAQRSGIPAPCSAEGKEQQRALRKQRGTWRQLRHKEDEMRLMQKLKANDAKKPPLT
jgi:hypothetical protein